jgi:hypothetical protein
MHQSKSLQAAGQIANLPRQGRLASVPTAQICGSTHDHAKMADEEWASAEPPAERPREKTGFGDVAGKRPDPGRLRFHAVEFTDARAAS